MNWNALGAIGEIVGAAAVLVTLIFLTIQMRQNNRQIAENTRVIRLAARGATQEAYSRFRTLIGSSPEVAELYLKGCADYRALSRAERLRFGSLLQEMLIAWNLQYLHFRAGFQEDTWQNPLLLGTLSQPGARYWWDRNKLVFDSVFVDAIEGLLLHASPSNAVAAQQGAAAA